LTPIVDLVFVCALVSLSVTDSTQKTLESARKVLEVKDGATSSASSILDELDKQQKNLETHIEDLYASLNVDLPSDNVTRVLTLGGVQHHWYPSDAARLRSPTARLNSECMNSGAALLKSILLAAPSTSASSAMCCIFSTHDLSLVRDGSLSDAMWRHTRMLEYWTKTIWIIPIHRVLPYEHWVLAVAQLKTGRIFLFNSLAEPDHWLDNIEVRSRLLQQSFKRFT
jgi:hypothetical protein